MKDVNSKELSVLKLRRNCNFKNFNFKTTKNLPELKGIIGQNRALQALNFGVEIKSHGYHIYVLGPTGTGKKTIINKFLKKEGNYCAEIYITRKGKDHNKWEMEVISNYEAHQANFIPKWRKDNPTGKLVMRLFINDMVAYEEKGEGSESYTKYCRVKKIDGSTPLIYLISHVIAIDKETYERSWAASANKLQEKNARQISVDILGQVKDPGSLRSKK